MNARKLSLPNPFRKTLRRVIVIATRTRNHLPRIRQRRAQPRRAMIRETARRTMMQ
jgi:hypothetical protein